MGRPCFPKRMSCPAAAVSMSRERWVLAFCTLMTFMRSSLVWSGLLSREARTTPTDGFLVQEENFPEGGGFRGVVRVGGHDVAHVPSPFLAFGRLGDGLPTGLILNLRIGKELAGLSMEENGVVVDLVPLLRTASSSGQIGRWRFSYSFSWPGLPDITKAWRIFFMGLLFPQGVQGPPDPTHVPPTSAWRQRSKNG